MRMMNKVGISMDFEAKRKNGNFFLLFVKKLFVKISIAYVKIQ